MKLLKDIKALLQGLGITGKHLGRHAITVQYPEQRDPIPERSRGMVVLLSDHETGELNCTACMLCAKACPTGAITIDAPRNEAKKRELSQFMVDMTICCFCGMCEEACNFCAIKMATHYEFSVYDRSELEFDIKTLQKWGKDVPYEDTRKRRAPVIKVGPAAETTAANTTVEIEKKKKAAEAAAKKAAEEKAAQEAPAADQDPPKTSNDQEGKA